MLRPILLPVLNSILPILLITCPVQAAEPFSPHVDALERSLELNRHEQLAEIKANPDHELNEFTTDGCSGGLSVGWAYLANNIEELQTVHGSRPPWESCCISHDEIYHAAGTREATPEQSFTARKEADLELRSCVLGIGLQRSPELSVEYDLSRDDITIIYTAIANLMYRAVRIGGIPCSALPWRWGYGWPECN
jgi:hypothetical protein